MTTDTLQNQIKGAWARGAATYDQDIGHGGMTDRLHDYWLQLLRRVVGPAPLTIVDVGSGTGFLAVLLAELGHHVQGVDLSPEMLHYARQRAERAGVTVQFETGDATALPQPDSSVDVAISRHLFWTMTDPRAAVKEWVRVVRPGGRVIWLDWLRSSAGVEQQGRRLLAAATRRAQRLSAPHEDHAYPEAASEHLPMRGLSETRTVDAFLLGLGITDAGVRRLPALAAAERREQPLYRRIEDRSSRYVASFTVTPELRRSLLA